MTDKRGFSIHVSKSVIPGAITGMSIFAGYIAIAQSLSGAYTSAAWFILAAALFDLFDGRVARAIKATSDFGVQFDSLADVVNYGVAPSLLFYKLYFQDWGFAGIALSFLPVMCAAVRLARFNVQAVGRPRSLYFTGLPTTVAAVFLASYIIFADSVYGNYGTPATAALLMVTAALLMVSAVRYEKKNPLLPYVIVRNRRVVEGVIVLATIVVFPTIAFFVWSLLYIVYGLGRGLVMIIKD